MMPPARPKGNPGPSLFPDPPAAGSASRPGSPCPWCCGTDGRCSTDPLGRWTDCARAPGSTRTRPGRVLQQRTAAPAAAKGVGR